VTGQAPSVGRIVHYRSHGTPCGEYLPECRAAVVTETGDPASVDADLGKVGLAVLNPEGMFFKQGVPYDGGDGGGRSRAGGYSGGTWHWPERV